MTEIKEIVAEYFHIEESELSLQTRECEIVKARHIAMFMYREFTHYSFKQIGQLFNRDHASVIHAIKSVNNQLDTDRRYARNIIEIKELIKISQMCIDTEEVYLENDCYTEKPKEAKPKKIKPIDFTKPFVRPFQIDNSKTGAFTGYRVHSL